MSKSSSKFDVHQEITNRIVDALESAGEFQLPWIKTSSGSLTRPVNVASKKPYNGVNIVSLWVSALVSEFPSNLWGTYRQWQAQDCQVRKGEMASLVVFYKTVTVEQSNADQEPDQAEPSERMFARASWVFNAAQVDGVELAPADLPSAPLFDPIERAECFAQASGAVIKERGERACYVPALDVIQMPERRRFAGTETSSAVEAFYSTLCHELTHWTGAKSRLDRGLSGRFGNEAYAMEELVLEN